MEGEQVASEIQEKVADGEEGAVVNGRRASPAERKKGRGGSARQIAQGKKGRGRRRRSGEEGEGWSGGIWSGRGKKKGKFLSPLTP
jgi:hypothetical protein